MQKGEKKEDLKIIYRKFILRIFLPANYSDIKFPVSHFLQIFEEQSITKSVSWKDFALLYLMKLKVHCLVSGHHANEHLEMPEAQHKEALVFILKYPGLSTRAQCGGSGQEIILGRYIWLWVKPWREVNWELMWAGWSGCAGNMDLPGEPQESWVMQGKIPR